MTADAFGGVDIDLLADYVGGALDGTPEHESVAALVATDPAWRRAYAELANAMVATIADLAALGAAPEPMPADVAERLDAALEAARPVEADLNAAATGVGTAPGSRPRLTVVRGEGSRPVVPGGARRKKGPRWAAPIAAAAAVLAFAGLGIDYLVRTNQVGTDNATSSSAGLAKSAPMMVPDQASDAAGLIAALPAPDAIRSSGTDYRDLGAVRALGERGAASAGAGVGPANEPNPAAPAPNDRTHASAADPLARLRPEPALRACLTAVAGQNAAGPISVQSVDYARYLGTPALVTRFTAANGTWVWASGATCGAPGAGASTLDRAKVG